MKLTCSIATHAKSYEIEICHGLLNQRANYFTTLASKIAIITDAQIASLYGESLLKYLFSSGLETYLFSFPNGEKNKNRSIKEQLENQMFEKGLGRDTCIIALGGGVVTDLGGYIAATYCRGVPLVMIPTSLLAMVDASIGGKTGINVPHGKNMLGCIYQPQKVFIDPSTLQTLSKKELINGVVEMIKHAMIKNDAYFKYLDENSEQLLTLDPIVLKKAIFESCQIKNEIVEQDEKEIGKRRLLNFGHTIGHALETLTDFDLPHGQAVALGILFESYLAVLLGHLKEVSFHKIRKIFLKYGLSLQFPQQFSLESLQRVMSLDKKSLKGQPRFVIIDEIGSALEFDSHYCTHVDPSLLEKAFCDISKMSNK